MKKKIIIKLITISVIFILGFIFHSMYDWFPNRLSLIFFPVNESIWEHMKMLASMILMGSITEYILSKLFKVKFNNFSLNAFLVIILNIFLYLIIYLPVYYHYGEVMWFTISWLLISIIITQISSYFILTSKPKKILNYLSLVLIPCIFVLFTYLTYHPFKTDLFYDSVTKTYGLNK